MIEIKEKILKDLFLMKEEKYGEFSSKLMPSVPKEQVIGIRIPLLRKYAKKLAEYDSFLEALPHFYFEENNCENSCFFRPFRS